MMVLCTLTPYVIIIIFFCSGYTFNAIERRMERDNESVKGALRIFYFFLYHEYA